MDLYKTSRYLFLILSVVCLSYVLPKIFWLIFDQPVRAPHLNYSIVENEFVINKKLSNNTHVYETQSGKKLSYIEYQEKLPLLFYRTLIAAGTMPDSIQNVKMDAHDINMTTVSVSIPKAAYDVPDYEVYSIFVNGAVPGKVVLSDMFLRKEKNAFGLYSSKRNTLLEKKTQALNDSLSKYHFQFPPRVIGHNYSLRQRISEGFLISDALNHLYRIKFDSDTPKVEIVRIPRDLITKHLKAVELRSREFSYLIISEQNEVYLLLNAGNEIQKLPVKGFDPDTDILRILGNMFHKDIMIFGETKVSTTTVDEDYNFVDYMEVEIPGKYDTPFGYWAKILFPFELLNKPSSNNYTRVSMRKPTWHAVFVNLFLFLLMVFKSYTKHKSIRQLVTIKQLMNYTVVLLFGIYAIPGCLLLPLEQP